VRLSGAALFSAALAAVAGFAVYTALRWPPKAALFPLVMGIPLLVLAVAQLVMDLRERPPATPEARRAWGILAWMVGFIVLVLLLGFPLAVPVFVLAYLVTSGRESWLLSVVLAAAAWGAFYLLFQRLLHFPFEDGLITGWF
jgi:cytochrome b561